MGNARARPSIHGLVVNQAANRSVSINRKTAARAKDVVEPPKRTKQNGRRVFQFSPSPSPFSLLTSSFFSV